MKITHIEPRAISDSRGKPTIEVKLYVNTHSVTASVPSGKSAGSKEAKEKRDHDGGVTSVIQGIIERITPALINKNFSSQKEIDDILTDLDGTEDKGNLGGNALLSVSIGATKLFALEQEKPAWKFIAETNGFKPQFPRLYMNMLNGGAHSDFRLPFQEYIVIVEGSPKDAYDRATTIFGELGEVVKKTAGALVLGDEGGYSPTFETIEKPFELLKKLVSEGDGTALGIDAAATEFYEDGVYTLLNKKYSRDELLEVYANLIREYGVKSIEDPFAEDDVLGFSSLTQKYGNEILIVGDDLTVTNPVILKGMVSQKAANALIVKPNQIGTLTEVYETIRLAQEAGWKIIASHRSGETHDSFIADLAVGVGAYGLKAGAPTQKERVAKYDRLIEIEKEFFI